MNLDYLFAPRPFAPSLMELLAIRLMKLLAIPLSNQKTVAKWLVISPQAGKSLVIRRRPESSVLISWTPAFAGVTNLFRDSLSELFYTSFLRGLLQIFVERG